MGRGQMPKGPTRGWNLVHFGRSLPIGIVLLSAVYLLIPPLFFTVLSTFRVPGDRLPFESDIAWGLSNLRDLYAAGLIQRTALDTLVYVSGSAVLATTVGFLFAWMVERTDLPLRRAVFVLILFPLLMPGLVVTIGWLLLLGEQTGLFNVALRTLFPIWEKGPLDVFSMHGMVLIQGLGLMPLAFLFLRGGLRNIDRSLEEASLASGAGSWTTFLRVTLPILRPGLLGAVIVTAVLTVESFEVPLLLAGGAKAEIFSVRLYTALNDASGAPPNYGIAGALGLHFLVITYVLFSLFQFFTRRGEQFTTIGGRTLQPRRHNLGPWRWPVLTVLAFLLSMVSAAPFAVLVWTSLLPQYFHLSTVALGQVSLDQYRELLADGRLWGAWRNTVIIALAAPTISVGVSAMIAWVVVRARPSPWRTILDLFMSSSIAIPAAVAGSAFLLFYVRLDKLTPVWLPLLGTVLVLVLVYAHRLTVAYRISQTSLLRIGAVLEEASSASGARPMQTLLRIVLPLAIPGLAAAWVTLLVVAVRELTLPLIVGRESPPLVISVLVWKLWGFHTGQAAALGVLTIVFLATAAVAALVMFRWCPWQRHPRGRGLVHFEAR